MRMSVGSSRSAIAISRRTVVAGGLGLATTSMLGLGPARADSATVHRFKHGAAEIIVVSDGHIVMPKRLLTTEANAGERDAILASLGQTGEMMERPTNVTLVRSGSELVLIDTGAGPNFMPTTGRLLANLEAAGISADAVTKVVFTHGHPDHLWGALDDFEENPRFPNATHYFSAAEWDFWASDNAERGISADRSAYIPAARRSMKGIEQKTVRVKDGDDILPGLRVLSTPGHTQGHISLALAAGSETLVVVGDALIHPVVSFAHPDWRTDLDHEAERAVETRKRLLDRLASDKSLMVGFHMPFPGVGRVERKDGVYRYVAGA
jgi:glyoxylase-like metal-dependent hydrolase (beta-lactamase superfamily II)